MVRKYALHLAFFCITFSPFLPAEENSTIPPLDGIKHVVVVMLENRSFDNTLGWLYNSYEVPQFFLPSTTDPHYHGLSEDTLNAYTNHLKDKSGNIIFSCAPIKGIPSVDASPYINSPSTNPHESFYYVKNQVFGFDANPQANMTGFLQDYASQWDEDEWSKEKLFVCSVMETYRPSDLPILSGLAKHYAVSDEWFSSVPTQTNPNRAFAACGTSEGQVDNGPVGKSLFKSDTIWNRLTDESPETTWAIFWHCDMLPGLIKGPFTGPNTFSSLARIPDLNTHYLKMDVFHDMARKGQLPHFSFIEPQWTLSENIATRSDLIQIFASDENVLAGLQGNDLHPPGDVRTAENMLANIYTSLIANPETWNQTLLIITFDEHGGLFDHVPPPASISPDDHFQNGFLFDRYGVRVPALFISPRIKKNTVVRSENPHIPFDHTSLLATLLKWKQVDPAKWSMGKRVEAAPSFEHVLTLQEPRKDYVIKEDFTLLPRRIKSNIIQMEDKFYLRDRDGNYLCRSRSLFKSAVRLGPAKDRVQLGFVGGCGSITHGSFIVIQSEDDNLQDADILGTSIFHSSCIYSKNAHEPNQWWTIKSVDRPYLGYEIQYGEKVYLENHIYLDPCAYIPARLTNDDDDFLGDFLKAQPIIKRGAENYYWILEKVENASLDYSFETISS